MGTIIIEIKGRPWTFILMNDKKFDRLHNQDDGNRTGVTLPHQYEVHFKKSEWTIIDIRHEIGHILFHMSRNDTADLTAAQVEETMCQLIGHDAPEIVMWADRVAERFFGRES